MAGGKRNGDMARNNGNAAISAINQSPNLSSNIASPLSPASNKKHAPANASPFLNNIFAPRRRVKRIRRQAAHDSNVAQPMTPWYLLNGAETTTTCVAMTVVCVFATYNDGCR